MLKQLVQLRLCDEKLYDTLLNYQSVENADELKRIILLEGYTTDLIIPSMVRSISTEYIEIVRRNYEDSKISYGKLEELLGFIEKVPEDYGYVRDDHSQISQRRYSWKRAL